MRPPITLKINHKKIEIDSFFVALLPYLVVLLTFIIIPMLLIVFYAFVEKETGTNIYKFSLKYFIMFFSQSEFIRTLANSLKLAFYTTIGTILVGYPLAYIINTYTPKIKNYLILVFTIPMWVNLLLRIIALRQILDEGGLIYKIVNGVTNFLHIGTINFVGTDLGVTLGMVYVFLPFMLLPLFTTLSKIDQSVIAAAGDLGANWLQTFLRVILPLSIPGILSGFIMVFLPSATTLIVASPIGMGGGQYFMIGNLIERKFLSEGIWSYGSAISLIMAVIIIALTWLVKKTDRFAVSKR